MVQQYVPTRRVSKRLLITDTDCADPSDVVPNKLKRLQKLQQEREEANNAPLWDLHCVPGGREGVEGELPV